MKKIRKFEKFREPRKFRCSSFPLRFHSYSSLEDNLKNLASFELMRSPPSFKGRKGNDRAISKNVLSRL